MPHDPSELLPVATLTIQELNPETGEFTGTETIISSQDLDMDIEITGDTFSNPTTARIDLWNIGQDTLNAFTAPYVQVTISLGYADGQIFGVFLGIVRYVLPPEPEGADLKTSFWLTDNTVNLFSSQVYQTFKSQPIELIASSLNRARGIPIGRIDSTGVRIDYTSGTGASLWADMQALTQLATYYTQEEWYFMYRIGSFDFVRQSSGERTAVLLSPGTGLLRVDPNYDDITSPESEAAGRIAGAIALANGEAVAALPGLDRNRYRRLRISSVMKPQVTADAIIGIKHSKATGYYRVATYTHKFSTTSSSTTTAVMEPFFGTDVSLPALESLPDYPGA